MSNKPSRTRLFYLDSLKYIFCLIIFWTHFTGVFWTMCELKPELRPELTLLFMPPLSILVDSNLALYGFCMISGYLASGKRINSFKDLIKQLLLRYIRFVIPFFFINSAAFLIFYTIGFPTRISSLLLHNSWVGTFYDHDYHISELVQSSLCMGGDLNGPLWMMKYIFGGTCLIFIYNYIKQVSVSFLGKFKGPWPKLTDFFFHILAIVFLMYTFLYPPEPNFFHLDLVLLGVVLKYLNKLIEDHFPTSVSVSPHSIKGIFSDSTLRTGFKNTAFFMVAFIPVFLDAGGLVSIISPYVHHNFPGLIPYFTWNMYWVIGFSFFLILGIMNCTFIQKLLEIKPLKAIAPTNFSVYLVHFPVICCFSLNMYILMVNRISYSKVFVILAASTFAALFTVTLIYEKTLGKLQNRIIYALTRLISLGFPD